MRREDGAFARDFISLEKSLEKEMGIKRRVRAMCMWCIRKRARRVKVCVEQASVSSCQHAYSPQLGRGQMDGVPCIDVGGVAASPQGQPGRRGMP